MKPAGVASRRGFTLIELLVVVAIILLLVGILLPALSSARQSAQAAACGMHLKTFGTAFEMYASADQLGARSSGAFDHLRDGDIRKFGWVADVINLKIGSPGEMLCPSNRYQVSEKVGDYTGASTTGSANPNRPHTVPVVPVGVKSAELWTQGYNTNYATSWHFSRGDPTAADGYGSDGDPGDPSKSPLDGDGPLNGNHLGSSSVSPSRIVVMGDARVGDGSEASVSASYAQTVNTFADEPVLSAGDFTVESFTDGMSVDYSAVSGDPGRQGHEFNDIAPLHKPRDGDYVGGFANVLFADGHVSAVFDSAGLNGDQPDGFLGPYKNGSTFEINQAAFKEIRSSMWWGRIRPKPAAGGGSIE